METPTISRPTSLPHPLLSRAAAEERTVLFEHEVYALLEEAGIETPTHCFVREPGEVDDDLLRPFVGDEVMVKIVSPQISHKSDVGGVALCRTETDTLRRVVASVLESVATQVPHARREGVLIAERVAFHPGPGREVLAGFRHDPAFGPVLVAGIGGLDTEFLLGALEPRAARGIRSAAGLDTVGAHEMLRGTLVHAALSGRLRSGRGSLPADGALEQLVVKLADLANIHAGFAPPGGIGIAEMEINPFVVTDDGRLVALDGFARIHRPRPLPPARRVEGLSRLLTPSSAVVIGVSAEGINVGRIILRNLVEGGGIPQDRIWVVHPKAEWVEGCRVFRSPADLPEPPDMAIVAVPADRGADRVVIDLVENHRAHTVTLIAGGFAETTGGRDAEAAMRRVIERSHLDPDGGVLVNGGNCLGIVSVPGGYSTFFLPPYKLPFHDAPGDNVASISQSGAYLVSQISNLDRAVRPRYAISFGNQMDVTVADYLEYLSRDDAVRVFAVYLEGFRRGDGLRFLAAARHLTEEGRTVLLYKAGRTREGRAAAASHTAAAVGDYEVCREAVRAAGVIDCHTLDMFEDYLLAFSFLAGKNCLGRRTAVVSNAGFECTAAADKLYGLELAELNPLTRERLRKLLPPGIVDVHNPLDATPITPTENYAGMVQAMLDDPNIDALVVAGVPATPYLENLVAGEGHREDITHESSLPSQLIRIFHATEKPVVFSVDSGPLYEACVQMMKRAGLPCFRKVDRATRALGAVLASR